MGTKVDIPTVAPAPHHVCMDQCVHCDVVGRGTGTANSIFVASNIAAAQAPSAPKPLTVASLSVTACMPAAQPRMELEARIQLGKLA